MFFALTLCGLQGRRGRQESRSVLRLVKIKLNPPVYSFRQRRLSTQLGDGREVNIAKEKKKLPEYLLEICSLIQLLVITGAICSVNSG